jgi:hypothetical protein
VVGIFGLAERSDAPMNDLCHGGRRLVKVHPAGRVQHFPKNLLVNLLVARRQARRVEGLSDQAGNAVKEGIHDSLSTRYRPATAVTARLLVM